MDVETFTAAKEELEHAYRTHMISRAELDQELKELRQERQDDRNALLLPREAETEPLAIKPRRLYPAHKMKLYRSRRRQILFLGSRKRNNSRSFIKRRI